MCILVILRNRVAGWPLVVGSNRDEYRDRPWDPPRLDGDVLAPRDRRAGGSWIGLARGGLLVAVTNRPDPDPDPRRPSRGILAMDLLRTGSVAAALGLLREEVGRERRNAFQALVADPDEASVAVYPGAGGGDLDVLAVPDGLHTLTNRRGLDELPHGGALDPADLPPGTDLETAVAVMKCVLGVHADRGPGGPDVICKHGPDRGTLSSTIVALPADPERTPVFLMAPGAPCSTPFVECGGELGGRPAF